VRLFGLFNASAAWHPAGAYVDEGSTPTALSNDIFREATGAYTRPSRDDKMPVRA